MKYLILFIFLLTSSITVADDSIVQQMWIVNNAIRAQQNPPLPPQELDERLCKAAQNQADHIARTGEFDHHSNGNPRIRAAKFGFPVRDLTSLEVKENIAGDFQNVQNCFKGWMGTSHRDNILLNVNKCGFGMATNPTTKMKTWVAVYGNDHTATLSNKIIAP